jgi:hypothetical protein
MAIPNVFHFAFGFQSDFGGKPFGLVHYLAIKSACEVNSPAAAYFYCKHKPEGFWFEQATPYITYVPIEPPVEVFGRTLRHYAHQADVFRLEVLLAHGGVYMDLDTICRKPFTPLLAHDCVLGVQGTAAGAFGLCNGVILAEPASHFITRWYETYRTFRSEGRDEFWDEHSVRLPLVLSRELSEHIHVEPHTSFHDPFPREQWGRLFDWEEAFPDAYCHHLWESVAWHLHLADLTAEKITTGRGSYHALARRFL